MGMLPSLEFFLEAFNRINFGRPCHLFCRSWFRRDECSTEIVGTNEHTLPFSQRCLISNQNGGSILVAFSNPELRRIFHPKKAILLHTRGMACLTCSCDAKRVFELSLSQRWPGIRVLCIHSRSFSYILLIFCESVHDNFLFLENYIPEVFQSIIWLFLF